MLCVERVYIFDKGDEEKLKKLLSYDPYTDPSIIPPGRGDDPEREKAIKANMEKLANDDPLYDVIFARQEYSIRDGASLGLDENKIYLYIKANEDFIAKAELKLKKNFESFKRASLEEEQKVIAYIKDEQERSNAGFGMIFGGGQ